MLKRVIFVLAIALSLWFISRMPVAVADQPQQDAEATPDTQNMEMGDGTNLPLETRQLIDDVRGSTADFRDVDTAEKAGYAIFQNCFTEFTEEGGGGMGQHFVNGDLAGDDKVDPLKPEALVYEPREDGKLLLVALEYLVFADNWKNSDPPTAFGQKFHLLTDIPDTPPVWALHIWLWSDNPDGLFADYNPIVFCPPNVKTQS